MLGNQNNSNSNDLLIDTLQISNHIIDNINSALE